MDFISLNLPRETRNTLTLNSPAVPLNSRLGWDVLSGHGVSDAAELVSPGTSMGQATVNSCVQLLSTSIASMNPILYERAGNGKVEAFGNPLHHLLCLQPNPECSAFSLWAAFVASILLWGNGYIELQRNGAGVQGLWFLPPQSVSPTRQNDGSLVYRVTQGMQAGQFRVLQPEDIIHVPGGFSVDGITGVSVISQARNVIGGAIALDRYGNRFFSNSAQPSMALVTSKIIKPEDKTRMRQDWEALQGGSNQFRTAILDAELDVKILSIPNSDSQFLESRKLSREEICGLFGVKPSQIGDTARVAGETYAAQQLDWLVNTLGPWLQKIRQELTRKLLAGLPQYEIRHDTSDRLKLDVKSQMDAFAVARQWGLMTSNQCRKELGLDPGGPECDEYWRPVNMVDSAQPNPTQTEGTENV